MPRNNTLSPAVPGRAILKSTGRRKPAACTPGGRVTIKQQPQQPPERRPGKQDEQQQQAVSTAWREFACRDHELDEQAGCNIAVHSAQDAGMARQRIEMLREKTCCSRR